jgi:hypothetical protein
MRAVKAWGAVVAMAAGVMTWAAAAKASPIVGQIDDFEGTPPTQSWTNGHNTNAESNVNTGGPAGAGDNYLRIAASGGVGAGSRLAAFNMATRWVGNYTTAGVTGIEMDLKNLGTAPLQMRLGLEDTSQTRFSSTLAFPLPADGLWHHARFGLGATDLTRSGGSAQLATALTRVRQLRVIHSSSADFTGDPVNTAVGVDNIRAVPEPSAFGLMLGGACGGLVLRRRR